jgi:nicotinate phosphoribosyltransferase
MTPRFDYGLAEGMLHTDQYQLTMAQLYFRMGIHERRAQFDHFFRKYPDYGAHQAGFCINAGMEWLLDWMDRARFGDREVAALREMTGRTGERLFQDDFLDWLRGHGDWAGFTMMAVPEGRVVHANAPLTVVQAPLAMAQILETPLLNHLNYQSLIATKAARVRLAAGDNLMVEFGMRRAPERGATAGVRAALIGGADFSSDVGASVALGYPPKGTHAHSMVQAFMALGEGEIGAFRAYAEVYPDDCLLLVDTIDTLESGVPNAIRVFEELREQGHEPMGIRLDSGDLADLSVRASKMLDDAGFENAGIFLSSELDEMTIWQIHTQIHQSAKGLGVDGDRVIGRLSYGVGTRLITSEGQPALNGVYKLVSVEGDDGWMPAIKVSDSAEKTLNPGYKDLWRIYDERGFATADLMAFHDEGDLAKADDDLELRHPADPSQRRRIPRDRVSRVEPLLEPVLDDGRRVREPDSIETMRERRKADMDRLDAGVKRLINPHLHHVSLSPKVFDTKQGLIEQWRQ